MMKTCIISPLGYTGIAYYDFSLCYALSAAGLEVDLFSVDNHIVAKEPNFKKRAIFVNTYGDSSRVNKGLHYLQALIKSYIFILKKKYKIVHFQKMELPLLDAVLFVLLKVAGKKIVYTPHDIVPFKYKRIRYPIWLTYRIPDSLIVHNRQNSVDLQEKFGIKADRISVIPHGNYNYFLKDTSQKDARKRLGLPDNKKIILLFGNIRAGKGIETAVSALSYMNKTGVLLLIAGKVSRGFDFEGLQTLIRQKGLEQNVQIRDAFIEDGLVEAYYRSGDVVAVPYIEGYESGVLKYAFSCGRPVIVSDLPEFAEYAADGENCLIFRKGDDRHFAEKLAMLLDSESLRHRVSMNAKRLSDSEWSWERCARQTRKVYENLAG